MLKKVQLSWKGVWKKLRGTRKRREGKENWRKTLKKKENPSPPIFFCVACVPYRFCCFFAYFEHFSTFFTFVSLCVSPDSIVTLIWLFKGGGIVTWVCLAVRLVFRDLTRTWASVCFLFLECQPRVELVLCVAFTLLLLCLYYVQRWKLVFLPALVTHWFYPWLDRLFTMAKVDFGLQGCWRFHACITSGKKSFFQLFAHLDA